MTATRIARRLVRKLAKPRFVTKASDSAKQCQETESQRQSPPAPRWPPLRAEGCPSVWRPRMTEQQKQEHEQYVRENNLPF